MVVKGGTPRKQLYLFNPKLLVKQKMNMLVVVDHSFKKTRQFLHAFL